MLDVIWNSLCCDKGLLRRRRLWDNSVDMNLRNLRDEDVTIEKLLPKAAYGDFFALLNLAALHNIARNWEQAYFWGGLYHREKYPETKEYNLDYLGATHLTTEQKVVLDKKIEEWEPAPIPDDVKQALSDLQAHAARGDPKALFDLGMEMTWPDEYWSGWGIERNTTEAIKLWERAATQGYIEAQFELGEVYSKGLGARPDILTAIKWYRMAAAQGHEEAQTNLDLLKRNGYE